MESTSGSGNQGPYSTLRVVRQLNNRIKTGFYHLPGCTATPENIPVVGC